MSSERPLSENMSDVASTGSDEPQHDEAPPAAPIDSSGGTEQQPVTESDEPQVAENDAASTSEGEQPKRRVTLNPTVGAEPSKAIPTYSSPQRKNEQKPQEGATAEGESAQTDDADAEATPADAEQPMEDMPAQSQRQAVEIPSAADVDLDAELEAQIEAAMAGGMTTPEAAVPDQEAAGETSPAAVSEDSLQPGTRLKATVQSTHGDSIFVDLGVRSPGMIPARQFENKTLPDVGAAIDVVVDKVDPAEGLIHVSIPRAKRRPGGDWDALQKGNIVECLVAKSNKGGLEVTIGSLRGFLPASQVDLGFVSDLETFIGQKLTVQITDVNRQKRNLVVSRRSILLQERQEAGEKLWEELEPGQQRSGRVKTIKDYGAFIDLGGLDGFLHIGEMSWTRIKHPKELLSEGQDVDVQILNVDRENNKISLGMRQLVQDPWADVESRFAAGTTHTGTVTRTSDFGAFVELTYGVEGLIHISELDHRRVRRVTEVVKNGQQVDVKVLEVDPERKRISLSMKALIAQPQADSAAAEEESAPEPVVRKHKGPLKGGNSAEKSTSGGLFGNPSDFKK